MRGRGLALGLGLGGGGLTPAGRLNCTTPAPVSLTKGTALLDHTARMVYCT